MKIILLDNYDSFTYNLVHLVKELHPHQLDVVRNDQISLEEVDAYDCILLSPGPGIPDEAGIMKEIIRHYAGKKPIFGVCLGMQAIVEVFGGKIENLNTVFHGVSSPMQVTQSQAVLYQDLPNEFEAGRYHSWVAQPDSMPNCLEVTSIDPNGQVMSVQHKEYNIHAVQFHPESILTPLGEQIVANFLNQAI